MARPPSTLMVWPVMKSLGREPIPRVKAGTADIDRLQAAELL
jgi:hypothetical protein